MAGVVRGTPLLFEKCVRCNHHKGWHCQSCTWMFKNNHTCKCRAYAKDNLEYMEQEAFIRGLA